MGRKCNVLDCPSDSRRPEDNGVTFHKMPFHSDLRPKWIELCRIPEERQVNKVLYVCSRHFRRTDFCNFKGTKYMLRQGALPSVFPWTKSLAKLSAPPSENGDVEVKSEPDTTNTTETKFTNSQIEAVVLKIKKEVCESDEEIGKPAEKTLDELATTIKSEPDINEVLPEIKTETSVAINFFPGTRIEANDFNEKWYPATILEVDYDENEVFVEFDKHLNRANEWIPMDSSRLRPYQLRPHVETFIVGEKCMATWVDSYNKYPGTIRQVLDNDMYDVLFDDGFSKVLKASKISKLKTTDPIPIIKPPPVAHASPLFDPVVGSKEERRERKRKINVAELFGMRKKPKTEEEKAIKQESGQEDEKPPPEEVITTVPETSEGEEWTCRWLNGEPIGIESVVECAEGPRRSVIVPDHRLPLGWEKHLTQRPFGNSAGKWDIVLKNSDGKKFHTRHSLKTWLEETKSEHSIDRFDFCLHLNRARKLGLYEVTDPEALAATTKPIPIKPPPMSKSKATSKSHSKSSIPKTIPVVAQPPEVASDVKVEEDEEDDKSASLKIIHENDSYKCPIEGCGKNFRKENLAQMHIKHYHPEYTKFIGSTPNVADLAYARTAIEEDAPPKPKCVSLPSDSTVKPKSTIKVLTPKLAHKTDEIEMKKPLSPKPQKDAEIIRLLNSEPKSKTIDSIFDSVTAKLENHPDDESNIVTNPPDKYPEIKLQDLLSKSEPIPAAKKDEHRIKILLPLVRPLDDEVRKEFEENIEPDTVAVKVERTTRPGRKRQSIDHEGGRRKRQSFRYDTDEMSDYYYEADSHSQDSFKTKKSIDIAVEQPQPQPVQATPQVIIEGGEVIRLVHMRSEEIINCTCGITEEDGLMIQCELCLCWQHAHCNNIQRENQVPEKYVCYICKNPQRMRASKKYYHDQDWLKQGTLPTSNYHAKDTDNLTNRFEKLRKTHELSGCLIELNEYIHNLRVKLNIAENKDHPKLYLWNKPWEKPESHGTLDLLRPDQKNRENLNTTFTGSDHSYMKTNTSAFGDLALKTMFETPISDFVKSEVDSADITMKTEQLLCDGETKIGSQTELISILEDNGDATLHLHEMKMETEPPLSDYPKIDLNTMMVNSLPMKKEIKQEVLDDGKENALSSITSGILSTGSLDLALSQSDLDRLSSLAQLSDMEQQAVVAPQSHIPQPEAAIDSSDCRMHLLEHVAHFQNLVDERLNCIEAEISELEDQDSNPILDDSEDNYPKTKQTLQMLIRDLSTMRQIAALSN